MSALIKIRNVAVALVCDIEQQQIAAEIEHLFSVADQIEHTIEQGLKQSDHLR